MGNKLKNSSKRHSSVESKLDNEVFIRKQRKQIIVDVYSRNHNMLADVLNIIVEYLTFEIQKNKCKILLLGAGEVGKRTIFKQIKHIYDKPYDKTELLAIKPILSQNIIQSMRTLAIYSEMLQDQGKNTGVSESNREVRERVAKMTDKQHFTKQHYEDFKLLWSDPGIQATKLYRSQFQLGDSFEFLFENMHNYYKEQYIPTVNDLMISRLRTTGVSKAHFKWLPGDDPYKEYIYNIYLTGGQRNERRKWIHIFDNTQIVVDVINLSGYCKCIWEDGLTNRLTEDIELFESIVNMDVFKDCTWIVILNKYDAFLTQMEMGLLFSEQFKDFAGNNNNADDIVEYIKQKLSSQIRKESNLDKTINIQFYVTNALDQKCIQNMFDDIHQKYIENNPFI